MGGSGGGIIVRNSISQALSDPTVFGQLPPELQAVARPILAQHASAWKPNECQKISEVVTWALCHLA